MFLLGILGQFCQNFMGQCESVKEEDRVKEGQGDQKPEREGLEGGKQREEREGKGQRDEEGKAIEGKGGVEGTEIKQEA